MKIHRKRDFPVGNVRRFLEPGDRNHTQRLVRANVSRRRLFKPEML